MDDVIVEALGAIERRDLTVLQALLHPYLHWSDGEVRLRGRVNVLAHLATHPVAEPPAAYELRDGQIYRWTTEAE